MANYKSEMNSLMTDQKMWRVCSKGDNTNYEEKLTRGVHQGSPSSPVLLNMYINSLGTTADARADGQKRSCAVNMVADDFLIQANSQSSLQELANSATA